ncbi:hypothetical protein [uncultured Nitratireductor sp.]|uniref:hypothetical protein n=1 Tax=uncultured Nitratireductor sp. TaxID=520953 RepID=UPI0025E47E5A|nr:hypothetical protein [uncultured Nitratireductor sp.]
MSKKMITSILALGTAGLILGGCVYEEGYAYDSDYRRPYVSSGFYEYDRYDRDDYRSYRQRYDRDHWRKQRARRADREDRRSRRERRHTSREGIIKEERVKRIVNPRVRLLPPQERDRH